MLSAPEFCLELPHNPPVKTTPSYSLPALVGVVFTGGLPSVVDAKKNNQRDRRALRSMVLVLALPGLAIATCSSQFVFLY